MKIVYTDGGIEIPLEETRVSVLCVENQDRFAKMASDLWNQSKGGDGRWILSENDKVFDFAKETECVFNPFDVSINNVRTISRIHKELIEKALNEKSTETNILNYRIIDYLKQLTESEEFYLEYDLSLDMGALLKLYHLRFAIDGDSLEEMMIDYVRIMRRLLRKTVIVFLNLKQFIPKERIEQLLEDFLYEKVRVMLIEGSDLPKGEKENKFIIDSDNCIITTE